MTAPTSDLEAQPLDGVVQLDVDAGSYEFSFTS